MQKPSKLGKVFTILLGLVLVCFMTVEVAHSHPGAPLSSDSTHCQICGTAHIGTATEPTWLTNYVLHLIGIVSIGEPLSSSKVQVPVTRIRPPPVVATAHV